MVESPAGLIGRVFTGYQNDVCSPNVPSCDSAHAEPLDLRGTLTVNDITGATEPHGILEASDPAGGTMRITF